MINQGSNIEVSVCVQTYNHEPFIAQCLESILSQDINFKMEIILGEDDSKDKTREICKKYARKYPDIIRLCLRDRTDVIYVNGNPTGRFNMIENLKAAKGKYIALLEGDDYWNDPLKLQKQVDILEKRPEIIVCHHWHKYAVPTNDKYEITEAPKKGHGYLPREIGTITDLFRDNLRVKSRSMVFRNVIDENFFPSWFYTVSFGDVPLNFLLAQYGDFYFIDEPMAVYRQTGRGASTDGKKATPYAIWIRNHYNSYIKIWDFGNAYYSYKYNHEVQGAITNFYKQIFNFTRKDITSLFKSIYHNCVQRRSTFTNKLVTTFNLFRLLPLQIMLGLKDLLARFSTILSK